MAESRRETQIGEPVAIIGMACRLSGGIDSVEKFWDLLVTGQDVTSEIPADRWADHATSPRNAARLRSTVRHGAFLDDITGFDAEFFGILPREAEHMDPQQRILLEVAWEALEDAGIPPTSLAGTDTGVYIGAVSNDYERRLLEDVPNIEGWTGICTQMCGQANRISYTLDLRGPSLTVDTACSASLVAIHLARHALASGEIPLAIVGGVNVVAGPGLTVMLDAAGVLSPDGRSKAFDASADGYGRGEGGAVAVLKRLSDAVRAGDRVLAVIRDSAVQQDGRTNGIMAPSASAQAYLLEQAYRGTDPRTVDYVEAHGTGTPLGDPVEATALSEMFGADREPHQPLLIGSVKPNIGHLEAGAGIAALIKVVLAMRSGEIPPNLIFTEPTPRIPWADSGLQLVTKCTPWPVTDHPRRAGVSCYGYGGTLAHIVMEEAPPSYQSPRLVQFPATPRAFPVSGGTAAGLRANAARLADWLVGKPAPIAAVWHTLHTRRAHLAHRAAVVADTADELINGLRTVAAGAEGDGVVVGSPLSSASTGAVWVFSGHGSQWVGMGRELLATDVFFAHVIDDLGPVFQAEIGFTPREILLGDELDATDVIQPMIFATQVALAEVLRRLGAEPAAVIGHSVGEIAAAVVAGVLDRYDGARLVCRRSILLRRVAGQGAMAMVNLPCDDIAARLAGRNDISPAIIATPSSTVVAGAVAAVEAFVDGCLADEIPVRRVASDVAFHSPAMDPLLAELRAAANDLDHREPEIPVYRTAVDPGSPVPCSGDYWAANLRNPVRFADAVRAAVEDGHRVFLEVSSHPVVTNSIVDTLHSLNVYDALATGLLRRGRPEQASLLTALGALHCHGIRTGLGAMSRGHELVDLPRTAWQHRSFWRAVDRVATVAAHEVDSHTLLGGLTMVAGVTPLRLWQTHLDYSSRPYSGNHPVHGVEIIPAAVLLTTFLAASEQAGGPTDLVDLSLRSPVSLASPREVAVTLQENMLSLASRPSTSTDEDSWSVHTTAVVPEHAGTPAGRLDPDALRDRCAELLPDDFVHQLLASLAVPAMGFPWRVTELRRRADEELFAVVTIDEGATSSWAGLLDAALSLPTAVFPGEPTLRMPAAIGRIVLHGQPLGQALVSVRLLGEPDTVAVTISDVDGSVVAVIEELAFGVLPIAVENHLAEEVDTRQWADLDPEALRDYLVREVRRQVAEETKLPADELNIRRPLADLGVDSVLGTVLCQRLGRAFQLRLPTTLLWSHPSVAALAEYLAAELAAVAS
ncbi:MAG TPA: beta-ketoacyl synthase N-terminal-like domain-containing protein [Amycolatopsis sp.]|uniref:type I polyketide synthase n=1 Tax=Amycolatopsis sp. TaxID=37632 RepID=UPI002B4A0FBA|nr:beta-ketoacyl synthase N-terminal-like domain-containing protein [Amycolatopsis sp.]HKS47648.1 beta-ketoacyl synthase N-terminal-like domain-containing protein [Amycolatopsis sp.]